MHVALRLAFSTAAILGFAAEWPAPNGAAAEESFEAAAQALASATVTVRMQSAEDERSDAPNVDETKDESFGEKNKASGDERSNRRRRYSIASGVCVGENLFVTAARPQKGCEFRLTLPGGRRSDATLCVFDAHSSLALVEVKLAGGTDAPRVAPLAIAPEPAKLGTRLVAASAWGSEQPTVSVGVLGGVDRFIPSSLLPPLLQCDVHTTETSRGGGVVNSAGELVGIVVAFETENRRSNWTYLVGAEHVARLIAARKPGEFVELPRRVAHAGLDLRQAGGSEAILVRNVAAGGPAEKAGIRVGDELRSLDGRPIHSAIAAARIVGSRRPGDTVACVVRRDEAELTMTLTLEQSSEEPTISYTGKDVGENASNKSKVATNDPSGIVGGAGPDDVRKRPELSRVRTPDIKPATNPTPGKGNRVDTLDELRSRLRQQEELVKRLEVELAELRRERDRLAATPSAPQTPIEPSTAPPGPRSTDGPR